MNHKDLEVYETNSTTTKPVPSGSPNSAASYPRSAEVHIAT